MPEQVGQSGVVLHLGIFSHGVHRVVELVVRAVVEVEETMRVFTTELCEPLAGDLLRELCVEYQSVFVHLLLAEGVHLTLWVVGILVCQWLLDGTIFSACKPIVMHVALQVLHIVGHSGAPGPLVVEVDFVRCTCQNLRQFAVIIRSVVNRMRIFNLQWVVVVCIKQT